MISAQFHSCGVKITPWTISLEVHREVASQFTGTCVPNSCNYTLDMRVEGGIHLYVSFIYLFSWLLVTYCFNAIIVAFIKAVVSKV